MRPYTDILLWLVAIEVVGLATLPLAHRMFGGLPDRGYAASKILGVLLVSYAAWSTGILGLTGFTGPTIVLLTIGLAALSWWRWGDRVAATWREARTLAIGAEVTFIVVFLVGVWVRSFNAAIAGQEKQMDLTFLHSLIQASSLPAEDLWFARYGMPYYYLGYLTQAVVAKAVAAEPVIAYNLALASVLALSALGAFGLAAGLTRLAGAGQRWAVGMGATAAFALTIMGNLEALFEWIAAQKLGDAAFWSAIGIKNLPPGAQDAPLFVGGWWFRAARVIPNIQPDGITEFPYFSFLLGDLHPHYMAIPLGVLIATLAAAAIVSGRGAPASNAASGAEDGAWNLGSRAWDVKLVVAIVLGAVIPSNTWDVPVLWGTFALAFLAAGLQGPGLAREPFLARCTTLLLILVLAVALYTPYFVGYVSQPLGLGFVEERTYFGSLFVLFGPLVLLPLAAGGIAAYESRARWLAAWPLAAALLTGLLLTLLREPTLGFLLACLVLWLPLTWVRVRSDESGATTMTGIITCVGLGSILVAEVVFLRDVFGSRMNTVFKFYYDAWILLALAAPLLVWEMLRVVLASDLVARVGQGPGAAERTPAPAWLGAAGIAAVAVAGGLALGGAIYPVVATHTKSGGFASPPTLDGMAFLRQSRPDDAAAIEWLRRTHPGAALIEAVGNDYTDAGRFATFAGTPTLVGWVGHELQWRGPTPEIDRRQQLVRRVYNDPDTAGWRSAMNQLDINFVVVGTMERELYGQDVQARFEGDLPVVHRSGNTTIYRVPRYAS